MFAVIEKALQKQGISLQQFADAIGVSLSAVYEWRNERYKPKTDKLLAISTYLNIPLDELVKGQG